MSHAIKNANRAQPATLGKHRSHTIQLRGLYCLAGLSRREPPDTIKSPPSVAGAMSIVSETWAFPLLFLGVAAVLLLILRRWSEIPLDDRASEAPPVGTTTFLDTPEASAGEVLVIFTTPNPLEATLIQEILATSGIPTWLVDQHGQVRSAFTFDLSEYRVAIPSTALIKAQQLLDEYEFQNSESKD